MRVFIVLIAGLLYIFTTPVLAASLTQLETLLETGQYPQAWAEAQRLQKKHEGDPHFDYLLGLAALETGNADHALFALQRVVTNTPKVIRPRLELARTYLQLKNRQAALNEFRQVLTMSPPDGVRTTVQGQIDALTAETNGGKLAVGASFSIGYDSNTNSGAGDPVINTPIFGNITLDDASIRQGSPFSEMRGQLAYSRPVSNQQAWFVTANAGQRHYTAASDFDTQEAELQAGTQWITGKQRYQISVRQQTLNLGGQTYSDSTLLDTGLTHYLDNNHQLASMLTLENFDHRQQDEQDKQRLRLVGQYQAKVSTINYQLEVSAGYERADQVASKHQSRNLLGLGYSATHLWNAGQASSFSIQVQQSRHQATDPVYNAIRQDTRLSLLAGHQMQLNANAALIAQMGYVKSDSNLDLYTTKKGYIKLGINYLF